MAKKIADAGHEIASHGTNHDRLHRLNAESFREDLLASKHLLEDQTGQKVIGYRAPTFSIVPQTFRSDTRGTAYPMRLIGRFLSKETRAVHRSLKSRR